MAAFTALAIGATLGYLASRRKKKKDGEVPIVAPPEQTAAQRVEATQPVPAAATESANVAGAKGVAARTRRRAAAGNSGKTAGLPKFGKSQLSSYVSGSARSLLGS
jgi:hypothetical protein